MQRLAFARDAKIYASQSQYAHICMSETLRTGALYYRYSIQSTCAIIIPDL